MIKACNEGKVTCIQIKGGVIECLCDPSVFPPFYLICFNAYINEVSLLSSSFFTRAHACPHVSLFFFFLLWKFQVLLPQQRRLELAPLYFFYGFTSLYPCSPLHPPSLLKIECSIQFFYRSPLFPRQSQIKDCWLLILRNTDNIHTLFNHKCSPKKNAQPKMDVVVTLTQNDRESTRDEQLSQSNTRGDWTFSDYWIQP